MPATGGSKRSYDASQPLQSSNEIVADFILVKSAGVSQKVTPEKGNASSVLMSASKAKKKNNDETNNFPSSWKNALKRKQNVSLYIKDGAVV